MHKISVTLTAATALVLITSFQNCGGKNFSGSGAETSASETATPNASPASSSPSTAVSTTPAPTTSANSVSNALGQTIAFTALNGSSDGTATLGPANAGTYAVTLRNELSGRITRVQLVTDPSTGAFLAVVPLGMPFACYDPSANPCQGGYRNQASGALEGNCHSAIYYAGTGGSGIVGNLPSGTAAETYYNCN